MLERQTVWITGANSQITPFVIRQIYEEFPSSDIVLMGRSRVLDLNDQNFKRVLNVSENFEYSNIITKYKPNIVLNLVGAVPPSSRGAMWCANFIFSVNLLQQLASSGIRNCKVLFIGTAAEYKRHDGMMYCEKDEIGGENFYGFSKSCFTNYATKICRDLAIDVFFVRPFNIIGPGLVNHGVLSAIIKQLEMGKAELDIGRLDTIRDFIDVRDAVNGFFKVIKNGSSGEVYNICTSTGTSIQSVVGLVEQSLRKSINLQPQRSLIRLKDTQSVIGSNRKILTETDWRPLRSLQSTVQEMLQHSELI